MNKWRGGFLLFAAVLRSVAWAVKAPAIRDWHVPEH